MGRLFLASQDFGNHANRLSEMIGDNRRSLVVFNARDYKEDKGVGAQRQLFYENDLDFQELDLRNYFGKSEELRELVNERDPGVIALLGGNTFLLRRALAQSGMDEILRQDMARDGYVVAGHSAGSIVVGPSLIGFEDFDDPYLVLPGYEEGVLWNGLGLVDVRVIPHANSDKYASTAASRKSLFAQKALDYVVLNDEDVFVVDGDNKEVLI